MSKILDATCVNNKVTCEGKEVPNVTILSEGVSESSGVLILEDDRKSYISKISPDLKTTIEKLITALNDISSALTAIDGRVYVIASGSPDTFGPPVASSTISSLNSAISDLSTFKDNLK